MYKDFISKKNEVKKIIEVKISDISTKDFNPRKSGLLQENVEKLIKAEEFPPIHLGYLDNELIVVDGYHRLSATQKLGYDEIEAFITEFDSETDLRRQAFLSNVNHGIKLSEIDIALNIYEFYVLEKRDKPTTSLSKVISDYNIPNRRGRQLFFWTLINRVVLENNSNEITELSKCEEYIKIINNKKEKYDSLSLVLKDEIRKLYNKYNFLTVPELRNAINLYLDGKDYFQEKTKKEIQEVEIIEPVEIEEAYSVKIENLPHMGTEVKVETLPYVKTPYNDVKIENLSQIETKINNEKNSKSKQLSISNSITKIGEDIMIIRRLQTLNKIDFSKEDYLMLNDLIDRIDEIKSDIDTTDFFTQNIINDI